MYSMWLVVACCQEVLRSLSSGASKKGMVRPWATLRAYVLVHRFSIDAYVITENGLESPHLLSGG
jgi:hypothetical protein